MTGKIFSIEEFSTFDGPGIRMTVFLKGCPLRCTWCHNPEGQRPGSEYIRRNGDCLHCGACERAATMENGVLHLSEASAAACPKGLIRRCGEDFTVEALTDRILKNAAVLTMNGGGVTFSGGEPLMQAEFVRECMSRLRPKVHCAVQTCGFVGRDAFAQIMTMCDYVLYDLKLMDPEAHRKYCGVDNTPILSNYRALAASGLPFVTRIPLIPGVTDTAENLRQIASFMRECGVSYVEVLPYNKMAGAKYGGLLRTYQPGFDGEREVCDGKDIFAEYGIRVRRM